MVGHALHCECSESYEMSAASSRPVASAQGLALTSPPERQGLWGGEQLEEEWIMLFPADSTALSCFLLS